MAEARARVALEREVKQARFIESFARGGEHAQNVQNGRRTVDYMDSDGEIIQRVSEASEPAADLGRRRVYQTSRFDKNDVRFPYEK